MIISLAMPSSSEFQFYTQSLKICGQKERENTGNVVRHPFTVDKPKIHKLHAHRKLIRKRGGREKITRKKDER
jgi:hypothetical protein